MRDLKKMLFEQPFGSVLFGDERELPKGKPEKNIPAETDLFHDLRRYVDSNRSDHLERTVKVFDGLEGRGLYTDFLSVPKKYQYAYRILNAVSLATLKKILGYEPTDMENGVFYDEPEGGMYYPKGKSFSSWTVDLGSLKELMEEWEYDVKGYHIVLKAPIHSNGNRFLLNPDELYKIDSMDMYKHEQEVLSIGPVQCSHVWYLTVGKRPREWQAPEVQKLGGHIKGYEES